MPERWERELKRIGAAEPSDGLWQRAGAGPTRPSVPSGPGRRSRVVAAAVSMAVVIAAGFGLWNAFGHTHTVAVGPGGGPSAGPTTPNGYFVSLPDAVTARTGDGDTQLIVMVTVSTNLPDGTRASVSWTNRGGAEDGAGGATVAPTVKDGALSIDVPWGACDFGDGFSFSVEFRPFFEDYRVPGYPQGSPWPPTQSDQVLRVLGEHFQNVTGEQVTTVDSSQGPIQEIAVSRDYAWPDTPSGFVPPPCVPPPPTSPSPSA